MEMKVKGKTVGIGFGVLILAGFIAFLMLNPFSIIDAGTVGVKSLFGSVQNDVLHSGFNIINPLVKITRFSTKTQMINPDPMLVPSSEGLTTQITLNCLYRIDSNKAPYLYKNVGKNYQEVIIIPNLHAVVRNVTSEYKARALYTASRDQLSSKMVTQLNSLVGRYGIKILDIPLQSVKLPKKISDSIEYKLQAQQQAEQMQYVLEKAKQEAERKKIEAEGIANFQDIVTKGITPSLLKWKAIEATEELAKSKNAKIVIIGGKDGLPVMLNTK